MNALLRLSLLPILSLAAIACGARTPLEGAPSADGGGGGGAPIDGGATCGTWRALGTPVLVSTDPPPVPGDVGLQTAAAVDDGVLVAWRTASDLMTPATLVLRRVSFDAATLDLERTAWNADSVGDSFDDVSIADGFGHAALIFSSRGFSAQGQCELVVTDGVGQLHSAPNWFGQRCAGIDATASGFDLRLFDRMISPMAVTGVRTNTIGDEQPPSSTLIAAAPGMTLSRVMRATLDDGTYVVATLEEDSQKHLRTRHFDAGGAQIGATTTIAEGDAVAGTFEIAIARSNDGFVLGWTLGDSTGTHRVAIAALDRNGAALRAPAFPVTTTTPLTSFTLAATPGGDVLVAWTEYSETASAGWVQAIAPDGSARAQPIAITTSLATPLLGPIVRVVTSGARALVVLEARVGGGPHRVYAMPLGCAG